jgi:hypothetical protein
MHSRCLAFLLFKFGGRGGEKDFFHFSLVPNVLSLSSLQVPTGFPTGSASSQCVPQTSSPWHLTFILYALRIVVLLSPIPVWPVPLVQVLSRP